MILENTIFHCLAILQINLSICLLKYILVFSEFQHDYIYLCAGFCLDMFSMLLSKYQLLEYIVNVFTSIRNCQTSFF